MAGTNVVWADCPKEEDWDNVSFVDDPAIDDVAPRRSYASSRTARSASGASKKPLSAATYRARASPPSDEGYDSRLVSDWIMAQNPGMEMPPTPEEGGGGGGREVFVDPVGQSMVNAANSMSVAKHVKFPAVTTTSYARGQDRHERWPPVATDKPVPKVQVVPTFPEPISMQSPPRFRSAPPPDLFGEALQASKSAAKKSAVLCSPMKEPAKRTITNG